MQNHQYDNNNENFFKGFFLTKNISSSKRAEIAIKALSKKSSITGLAKINYTSVSLSQKKEKEPTIVLLLAS